MSSFVCLQSVSCLSFLTKHYMSSMETDIWRSVWDARESIWGTTVWEQARKYTTTWQVLIAITLTQVAYTKSVSWRLSMMWCHAGMQVNCATIPSAEERWKIPSSTLGKAYRKVASSKMLYVPGVVNTTVPHASSSSYTGCQLWACWEGRLVPSYGLQSHCDPCCWCTGGKSLQISLITLQPLS